MRNILIFVLILLVIPVTAQTAWTPEMQMKVKALGTPRVSPDGKKVVYTIVDAVMAGDKSEFVTQIYLVDINGGNTTQLTSGDASSTNPKWSPDSASLAFISSRGGRNNLFLLRLDKGEAAEPLTDMKAGISDFEWSPDGRSIAFTALDGKTEGEEKNAKERADYRWVGDNVKMNRLYLLPVEKDAGGMRPPRTIPTGDYTVTGFDWAPDGAHIVFAHCRTPSTNDWTTSDVSIADTTSLTITPLASTPAAEYSPIYSPDGKSIAVVVSDNPARWAQSSAIYVFPASGGTPKALAATYDAQPNLAGWSADGKRLYFSEAKGTATRIYAIEAAGGNRIDELKAAEGLYANVNINRGGTMFGFIRQTSDTPPEAFVSPVNNFSPLQVSRANAEAQKTPVGKTEVIRWKSTDGREIEGLLTYPVNYQKGQKVPLILNIHGGPAGVFQQTFIGGRGVYPLAAFAALGYAILRPNPRGSFGYGAEFRYANIKDWGGMDYRDLMAGVDKAIQMNVADPNRLGVMGWSYGGYMAAWIITQTKRFKAASAGAPVSDLVSNSGITDITTYFYDYFGGASWETPETYRARSPIFNIKGASTPTLIQHGEADIRVPTSQGYELYNALKAQNTPTRMMVFPRQGHGLSEPKMQLAAMQGNLDWFEKYLR